MSDNTGREVIMEQLIEFYAKKMVKQNEGYRFIKKEFVFVPIIQVYLSITKRDYFSLPLLDEIVLRLLNEHVHDVTELSKILGIERNLLEVTLADLYVKDLIYCAADKCTLVPKGRSALNELSIMKRTKECLKNIYLDPINETVLTQYEHLSFIEKTNNDDRKLDADFDSEDITVFKKNIENIRQLFIEEEMSLYNDKTKAQPSELLSIDEIENVYPKFVKIPFYIFVSESGYDIDITADEKKTENLLEQYKAEIISQIRNHKLLKNVFTKYALKSRYEEQMYKTDDGLLDLSRKYCKLRKESNEKEELRKEIERHIFLNRKLFDNEFEYLFSVICKEAESFVINVDCLDDWCFNNDFFVSILSRIGAKRIKTINYSLARNFETCVRNINRTIQKKKSEFKVVDGLPYMSIIIDDKWKILIVPEDTTIIDDRTHIYRHSFYLCQEKI